MKGLVLLSVTICFKLNKQLLDWDPSRVIFSAHPKSELGRCNKESISPQDGKGSERNGVHSAEVIPPLSPLSHQPTPPGARRLPRRSGRSSSRSRRLPHCTAVPQHLLPKGALEAAAASTPAARRQGEHSETARSRQAPEGLLLSVQLRPRSQLRRLLGRELH